MAAAATPEQNAAYNAGLCRTCQTKPYSAGRTRCNECHDVFAAGLESISGTGQPGIVVLTMEVANA